MSNNASLVFTVPQGGAPNAALTTRVRAVSLPNDILSALGVRVVSDVTTGGPPVVRTVDVALGPSAGATATVGLVPGDATGSPVQSVAVTAGGADYVLPPFVSFSDPTGAGASGIAYLLVHALTVSAGGATYGAGTFATVYGGLPPGNGSAGQTSVTYEEVFSAAVTAGGTGYSPRTTVSFIGGLTPQGRAATGATVVVAGVITGIIIEDEGDEYLTAPQVVFTDPTGSGTGATGTARMLPGKTVYVQGTPAKATVTVGGGVVTGVTLVTPGDGYVGVPTIVITDPTHAGSGAVIHASMAVGKVVLSAGGNGYTDPEVTLTTYFKSLFPDSSDQRGPLFNLLTAAISSAVATPVIASSPVMS